MSEARFELLRLAAEEVADGVAVVELEGRWTGEAPAADDARLVTDGAEVEPVPGSASVRDGVLRAMFAVPAADATDHLTLAADGVRVRLPEPDGERADRLALLARQVNQLRHERDQLRAEREDAEALRAELADARAELETTTRERDELRLEVQELETVRGERDEVRVARDRLQAERDEACQERDAAREAAGPVPAHRRPAAEPTPQVLPAGELERPPAVYYALAGLGVFGFLLVLVLLL